MRIYLRLFVSLAVVGTLAATLLPMTEPNAIAAEPGKTISLFDGKSFAGWEGDTNKWWKIQDGQIVGGSLVKDVPHNDFLCTTQSFTNFVLKAKFKLAGAGGFVNSGIQIRSKRIPNDHEVAGYQCDIGEGWHGTLYDEARRNKVLVQAPPIIAQKIKKDDWNEYVIRAEGKRIQTWINGEKSIDYTEPDDSIAQHGVIGLQVHGGGKAEARFKDLTIEEL